MRKYYWPVIGTILMAVMTAFQEAFADSHVSAQEWVQVALGVLMAFNVWATANLPQYERMKTYVAAAIAALTALYTFVIGGVDLPEWLNLIVIVLAALGVAATPQRVTNVVDGTTVPPDGNAV